MVDIYLNEILGLKDEELGNWTLCFNNAPSEGIYSFTTNHDRLLEHISWKKHHEKKASFRVIDTKYCLEFLRLDKDEKYDQWLFLGAYEVVGTNKYPNGDEVYKLKLLERYSSFVEKLIIEYKRQQGPKGAKKSSSNVRTLKVVKVLEDLYIKVGRPFPGYDNIEISFSELREIINNKIESWRNALSNVNGIYVITDTSNGKHYIGSTYGYNGVWQRWCTYVNTNGTGNNKTLGELTQKDAEYAEKNFLFSLLESYVNVEAKTKDFFIEREGHWKRILCTEKKTGYNNN